MKLKSFISIFNLLFACSFLIYTSSCKKFLNERPDDSITVPETIADLQALLDNSKIMSLQRTPSFGEESSDSYFLLSDTYNSFDTWKQETYIWNRKNYTFQNDWAAAYEPIYVSNFCLEGINRIPITHLNEEQWENVKGSALFYRSYYFLNLVWTFAKAYDEGSANKDLGIVLRLNSDFNTLSKRASVKECYETIIQDALEASLYLPDHPLIVTRPSKAAAYGLLARTYLSMRKYDSAFKYANKALLLKSELMDFNGDTDITGLDENIPFKPFNKEIIFYNEMTTFSYINAPFRAKIDTILYSSYEENDLRKRMYFKPSSGYYQFKGSYTATSSQIFTGLTTAELFLIKAECYARNDKIKEAFDELNILIKKRWKNSEPIPVFQAFNSKETLEVVLNERKKELYMRGVRWIDIKRLNKENARIFLKRNIDGKTYILEPNSGYYALPLPQDIIDQTGIQQN